MTASGAALALAALTVFFYACRMGHFDRHRDSAALGLTHYAGFSLAVWAGYSSWVGTPGPEHGAALIASLAWLVISYGHHTRDARTSGYARIHHD